MWTGPHQGIDYSTFNIIIKVTLINRQSPIFCFPIQLPIQREVLVLWSFDAAALGINPALF